MKWVFSSIVLSILSFAIGIHSLSYLLKGRSGEGLARPDQCWFFLITGTLLLFFSVAFGLFILFHGFNEGQERKR